MKLKRVIREYFTFSRRERNAALFLILCICTAIAFPYAEKLFPSQQPSPGYSQLAALFSDTLQNDTIVPEEYQEKSRYFAYTGNSHNNSTQAEKNITPDSLFTFDPNAISFEQWMLLGVDEKTAARIIHYREKGGVFRKKEDLLKTYGFTQKNFEILAGYIVIDSAAWMKKEKEEDAAAIPEIISLPHERIMLEINSATTEELVYDGVKEEEAMKIIHFRDAVGGFYSLEQVKETFGVNADDVEALFPYLSINASVITKIHLNAATLDELSKHSYIRNGLAQKIIDYRNAYGNFTSISELQKIIRGKEFERLKPYLEL